MFVGSKPKLNLRFCLRGVAVGVGVGEGVAVGVGIKWAAGGMTLRVQVGAGK
ncbi:GM23321 [Drosophila sechellia]|uniref:GD21694 n=2 Tax=melanogaster subgroup TaxID=32351 RepID=B4Q3F3_DROSI|nr:GM23321 [Drosophila sechellia]EDX05634.1 GD21694 [Drosophila simulans]